MSSTGSSATGAASSTSRAERLRTSRRRLLGGTALVAVAALAACYGPPVGAADRGEAFEDDTWFDDGFGWVD